MGVKVSKDTKKAIISIIVPLVGDEKERKSLLSLAWHDSKLLEQVDYSGDPRNFATRIVDMAIKYGVLEDGEEALIALLEELKDRSGPDTAAEIDDIIHQIMPLAAAPEPVEFDSPEVSEVVGFSEPELVPEGKQPIDSRPTPSRRPLMIGAAVVAVIVGVFAYISWGGFAPPPPTETPTPPPTALPTPTPVPSQPVTLRLRYAEELTNYYRVGINGQPGIIDQFNDRYCDETDETLGYKICLEDADDVNSGGFADSLIALPHLGNNAGCFLPGSGEINFGGGIPVLWQPSTARWLELVNYCTEQQVYNLGAQYNDIFVLDDPDGTNIARATTRQPGVVAIWENYHTPLRDDFLRDDFGWNRLLTIGNDLGWCSIIESNSTCRVPLYAHTDPRTSSTGLDMLMAQFYAFSGITGSNTGSSLLAESQLQGAVNKVRQFQAMSRHNAATTTVFTEYLAQGDDYIRFASLDENTVIGFNRQQTAADPLIAAIPQEGVFLQERPMGIYLGASVAEKEAARIFVDFVLTEDNQTLIRDAGFRPANSNVDNPAQFSGCTNNCGVNDGTVAYFTPPDGEVINRIRQMWVDEPLRRQTEVTLLLDMSLSLGDEQLETVRDSANAFIDGLSSDTTLRIVAFNAELVEIYPPTLLTSNAEKTTAQVRVTQTVAFLVNDDPVAPELERIGVNRDLTLLTDAIDTELVRIFGARDGNTCAPDIDNQDNTRPANVQDNTRPANVIVVLSDGKDNGSQCAVDKVTVGRIESTWRTNHPVIVIPLYIDSDRGDREYADSLGESTFIVNPDNPDQHYFEVDLNDADSLSETLTAITRFFGL